MSSNQIPEIDLLASMKMTAGSRFIAAKRLKRSYRRRQWIMVLASVVVLAVSAVTLIFVLPDPYPKSFGFVGLVASVLIVVYSAAQIESEDPVTSHLLYNSAVEISNMKRDLLALSEPKRQSALAEYAKTYGDLLSNYGVNHEDVDFYRYKATHKWEFVDTKDAGRLSDVIGQVKRFLSDNLTIGAAAAAAAGALGALLSALISH